MPPRRPASRRKRDRQVRLRRQARSQSRASMTAATITMWSRAATETRVQSQVDEYNATHQNKVELRLVPTDEYVGVVGNAATANELPDLFSADVVFMPNWTSAGPVHGHHRPHRRPARASRTSARRTSTRRRGKARSTACPSSSTCPCGCTTRTCSRRPGSIRKSAEDARRVRRRRPRRPGARTSTARTAPTSAGTAAAATCSRGGRSSGPRVATS